MRKVHIIRALGAVMLSVALILLLYLHFIPYQEFVSNLEEYFQAKLIDSYISQSKYDQWIVIPCILGALSVSTIIWATKISQSLHSTKLPLLKIVTFWRSLNPKIKITFISLIIINLIVRIYLALLYPISYDEAWTYLHFSSKGFLTSLAYYPQPNNHILHSLLTNVSYYLPFGQTLNLRLPSIFFNLLACIAMFFSFSKLLNSRIALVLLILFSFLFPIVYYGYNSRGYSLVLLAFIICFYASIQLLKNFGGHKANYKYIFYFSLGGIIGLFTMPSFLYAIIALSTFTIGIYVYQSQFFLLKKYIIGLLISGMTVLLLYSPAILVSGWESLSGNEFVRPIERSELITRLAGHFSTISTYLFNMPLWLTITILLTCFLFLFMKKHKRKELLFAIFILFFSPVLLILHSVIPFPRTWIYLIIPQLYIIGIFLNYISMDRKRWRLLIVGSVVLSALIFTGTMNKIKKTEQFSHKAVEAAEYLLGKQAKKVYSLHPLIHINLDYLFEMNHRHVEVEKIKQLPSELPFSSGSHSRNYLVTDKSIEKKGLKEVKNIDSNVFIYSLE